MLPKSFQTKIVKAAKKSEEKVLWIFLNNYQTGKVINPPKNISIDGSPFQKMVLEEVCKIPYGETRSYSEIALAIDKPRAVRAVASAIAKNKLLIVIPCHRVIRSDGKIGKYRGGEKLKEQLLVIEKQNLQKK